MGWHFGPPRSKFGKWMDEHGVSHVEMAEKSGVPRTTISNLATGRATKPTRLTARKLMAVIREIDPGARYEDLWG